MGENLAHDLAEVVNRHSRENLSNTPDFLLAEFMIGALEAVELFTAERDRWYGIAPEPGWQRPTVDERDSPQNARERAAWTRDIARMLREQTGVAPHLRPGYLAAADWLDPADGTPVRAVNADVVAHAMTLRLGEQREALTAAVEAFRGLALDEIAPASAAPVARWLERFGQLGEPPLAVEVEEDDDTDEPATDEPGAGESSGRWRPLGVTGYGTPTYSRCVNDTNGDGDCPACANNPDAPCRQVPDA